MVRCVFFVEVISDICGMLIAALTRNFQREKNAQMVEMLLYFKNFQRRLFSAT